jgi:ComF family protein
MIFLTLPLPSSIFTGIIMNLNLLSGVLDLIYPVVCFNCGNSLVKHEQILCSHCSLKLPFTNFHHDPVNIMAKALWGRVSLDFATAFLYFRKSGITQILLHQLKYSARIDVGKDLGNRFGRQLKDNQFVAYADYLVPVPLHAKKLRVRGFNQSEIICEGLQEILGIPILKSISRISYTDSQTKKRRFDRWLNVSEKFVLSNPDQLVGKRVLLIDDVFTTGATIEACCQVLKTVQNISIGAATIAITST